MSPPGYTLAVSVSGSGGVPLGGQVGAETSQHVAGNASSRVRLPLSPVYQQSLPSGKFLTCVPTIAVSNVSPTCVSTIIVDLGNIHQQWVNKLYVGNAFRFVSTFAVKKNVGHLCDNTLLSVLAFMLVSTMFLGNTCRLIISVTTLTVGNVVQRCVNHFFSVMQFTFVSTIVLGHFCHLLCQQLSWDMSITFVSTIVLGNVVHLCVNNCPWSFMSPFVSTIVLGYVDHFCVNN